MTFEEKHQDRWDWHAVIRIGRLIASDASHMISHSYVQGFARLPNKAPVQAICDEVESVVACLSAESLDIRGATFMLASMHRMTNEIYDKIDNAIKHMNRLVELQELLTSQIGVSPEIKKNFQLAVNVHRNTMRMYNEELP